MNKTKLEDTILRQRIEAASRIKGKYPELCAKYYPRCKTCLFWIQGITVPDQYCLHSLAPITSGLLPCPYYTNTP